MLLEKIIFVILTKQSIIMKKLEKKELKVVLGGQAPKCCLDWDPVKRRCSQWDFNCLNP